MCLEGLIRLHAITDYKQANYLLKLAAQDTLTSFNSLDRNSPEDARVLELLTMQRTRSSTPDADRAMQLDRFFLGRNNDMKALVKLLQTEQLITLTGPGGVGKTRLALEVESRLRKEDASYTTKYISLASIEDYSSIFPTLLWEFGIQKKWDMESLCKGIRSLMHTPHFLLVLDNFEHVNNNENVKIIRDLLLSHPNLKILLTSRTPLHVDYEYIFPVKPLLAPRLVQSDTSIDFYPDTALFYWYGKSKGATFTDTNSEANYIIHICQYLAGLPLAIRIAASWLKILGWDELLRSVSSHGILTKSNDDIFAPKRQQTLYHTFQWSYRHLKDDEKLVFRIFSLFVIGACSYKGLAQVCMKEEKEIQQIVRSLVDCSMVEIAELDGEIRILLPRPMYEFAREKWCEIQTMSPKVLFGKGGNKTD